MGKIPWHKLSRALGTVSQARSYFVNAIIVCVCVYVCVCVCVCMSVCLRACVNACVRAHFGDVFV